eukprot:1161465-Pelagomonas_calceolata.AAC.1
MAQAGQRRWFAASYFLCSNLGLGMMRLDGTRLSQIRPPTTCHAQALGQSELAKKARRTKPFLTLSAACSRTSCHELVIKCTVRLIPSASYWPHFQADSTCKYSYVIFTFTILPQQAHIVHALHKTTAPRDSLSNSRRHLLPRRSPYIPCTAQRHRTGRYKAARAATAAAAAGPGTGASKTTATTPWHQLRGWAHACALCGHVWRVSGHVGICGRYDDA